MNIGKIIPIELTEKTAYLAGVIIGDGHISNSSKSKLDKSKDYKIVIDISDKNYLKLLHKMIISLVPTKSKPKIPIRRGNRKERMYFQFRNKSFYYFLTKDLAIKPGNKSSSVSIPIKIKKSSRDIKKRFLAGLFDADGGFRGHSLGFTTASKKLNQEVHLLLTELSIKHKEESWNNKKYNKEYYGLRLAKSEINTFLKEMPLQNKEKLIRIRTRFKMRGCRSGQTG